MDFSNVKPYSAHREHFIERLIQRYDMSITNDEYDQLCGEPYKKQYFIGKFKKSSKKTIGILTIKNKEIVVLYNSDMKSLDTCYNPETFSNIELLINSSISRYLRPMAFKLYHQIIETCDREYRDNFNSDNEAAKYFFLNTMFPNLLISKFRFGQWDLVRVIKMIISILNDAHPVYGFDLLLVKKETINI